VDRGWAACACGGGWGACERVSVQRGRGASPQPCRHRQRARVTYPPHGDETNRDLSTEHDGDEELEAKKRDRVRVAMLAQDNPQH